MPSRRTLIVSPELAGARIDRAVAELLGDHSRSAAARFVEQGLVRIDTEVVNKASVRVTAGQTIDVDIPDAAPAEAAPQDLPLRILFQDDDLVVIDKPPALVVHPAAGHDDQTLVNALLFHVTDLSGIGGELRPGIVHRLDKDTSGVMVIAKHDAAHRFLTEAWGTPAVRKEYLALVYGAPKDDRGSIDAPIGRDPRDRKRMAIVKDGRNAITDYAIVEKYRYASLVRCSLRTGRTHQIRVHLKHLGHPIIGDPVYSGPQWKGIPDRKLQNVLGAIDRQMLHAAKLVIPHPRTRESLTFEAEMPADMRAVIEALR